jgi:hypothetical protein
MGREEGRGVVLTVWLVLLIGGAAAALAVSLVDGMKFYLAILFLVDPTVLYPLMRPAWDRFE